MTEPESKATDDNEAQQQQRRTDEKIQQMLQEAGLLAYPMDPVSLDALRELMEQSRDDDDDAAKSAPAPTLFPSHLAERILARDTETWGRPTPATMDRTPPPISLNATSRTIGASSGLQTPLPSRGMSELRNDGGAAAARTDDLVSLEERILQQLHQQTQMLLRLQERVDELHEHMNMSSLEAATAEDDIIIKELAHRLYIYNRGRLDHNDAARDHIPQRQGRSLPRPRYVDRLMAAAAAPPPPPQVPPIMNGVATMAKRWKHLQDVMAAVRGVYMVNLNVGLLVKVLFMLCVVMARMGGGSSRRETTEESALRAFRMATATVIIAGFLMHSGATKFIYYFYVKEKYVQRIMWEGEEFDIPELVRRARQVHGLPAAAVAPGQPQPPAAAAAAPNNNAPNAGQPQRQQQPVAGWQAAIMAGRLPRPQEAGPLAPLMEVLVFFFTFFLSIFPHWQPEALPPAADHGAAENEGVEDSDNDDDNDDDLDRQLALDQDGQLPNIRPPRDAFEPVDDDDY